MNILIWIFQILLAAMFAMAGVMKTFQPKEKLAPKLPWVNDFPAAVVKFIGFSELFGAIGLIVPWTTHIQPVFTPIAASALALVILLAAIYHISKAEYKALIFNIVLFALAVAVACYRFMEVPV